MGKSLKLSLGDRGWALRRTRSGGQDWKATDASVTMVTMLARPKPVTRVLMWMTVLLVFAGVLVVAAKFLLHDLDAYGLVPLFDLDGERNLPSLFSTLLILLCGFFLFMIGVDQPDKLRAAQWLGLAAIFAFLALDELVSIHERLIEPLRAAMQTSGVFYFAWVIPYGVAILVIGAIYLRFLFRLPVATRDLMMFSGVVYVGGAVGLELIGGWYLESLNGKHNLPYELLTTCEESLEMLGMILFARTLMSHIAAEHGGVCVLKIAARPMLRLLVEYEQRFNAGPERKRTKISRFP